jgi:hypothetical protein
MRTVKLSLTVALLLAGCTKPDVPPPGIEVRVQRVVVPVAVACVDKAAIPAEPSRIAKRLTGDARRDLDLVTASAIRLRAYAAELRAMLTGCAS